MRSQFLGRKFQDFTHNLQNDNNFVIVNDEDIRYTINKKRKGGLYRMLNNYIMDVDDLIFDGQEQRHSER